MKHVRVRMDAGGREAEIHPMYDVLANAPSVEQATALQWNFTGDALGMVHYVEGDADAFEDAVGDVVEVLDYEIERVNDEAFYAYVRDATTGPIRELFDPLTTGNFVAIPPVVYHEDGTVTMSLFGPPGEVQAAVEAVPDPATVDVEAVGDLLGATPIPEVRLSERQREAAEAAVELGYYEIPREASHEDVAEAIGCASSTAAEHLRKAESKVLRARFG